MKPQRQHSTFRRFKLTLKTNELGNYQITVRIQVWLVYLGNNVRWILYQELFWTYVVKTREKWLTDTGPMT